MDKFTVDIRVDGYSQQKYELDINKISELFKIMATLEEYDIESFYKIVYYNNLLDKIKTKMR